MSTPQPNQTGDHQRPDNDARFLQKSLQIQLQMVFQDIQELLLGVLPVKVRFYNKLYNWYERD
jgi:hypothetical protein